MSLNVIHIPRQRHDEIRGLIELDPVTAFLEDFGKGQSQLTLVCWGRAWTHYWGNTGENRLADFLRGASTGYIVGKLMLPPDVLLKRAEHREERWLSQIVEALKVELAKATKEQP